MPELGREVLDALLAASGAALASICEAGFCDENEKMDWLFLKASLKMNTSSGDKTKHTTGSAASQLVRHPGMS